MFRSIRTTQICNLINVNKYLLFNINILAPSAVCSAIRGSKKKKKTNNVA